ncbi:S8 family peptidase [Bacillus suaedaesalsae]|uniref:S8 family serine peptidase n=1 Tax=Bacillus suaedaesalsae TaxID=2810349 RepID=A0ABS2DGH6_9BACI|nr:S8 family serine peptidase [Bacillus suaedaesalsae]MBM6617582.1 S8 family serine peptidase [Bacillus suaedaesalsae]
MKWYKTVGSLVMAAVLIAPMYSTSVGASEDKSDKLRVLISSTNENVKKNAKADYGVRWDFKENGFSTEVTEKQYQALQKNKNLTVELVEEVSLDAKPGGSTSTRTAVPNDQTPWGIEAIYENETIAATSGGSGVKVAVLDTGAINHVDYVSNLEQCKDFTQRKSPLVNNSCNDGNGHGTHVAGTVLANGGSDGQGVYGVAPEAKLWAYKVLSDRGSGYSDDIAAAIQHAADEATRLGEEVIISMSLGSSTKSSLIADAVTYAYNKDVLVVAAAGNSGPNANTIGYPGALVDAVAVAALEDVQENGTYRVADFSSRGNPNTDGDYVIQELDVEVSAPGRAVESTWYDGGYNTISGTSMATPHVSGLAAKIWAANPSMTAAQLRAELQTRAKNNDILGGSGSATGDDYASGFGFPTVNQ